MDKGDISLSFPQWLGPQEAQCYCSAIKHGIMSNADIDRIVDKVFFMMGNQFSLIYSS